MLSFELAWSPWVTVAAFAVFLWYVLDISLRLRYWHLPGPWAWLVVGNLLDIRKNGSMVFMAEAARKYGPVFQVWFGSRMLVVITDPLLARSLLYKHINHAPFLNTMRSRYKEIDDAGLFSSRDNNWKMTRSAWQPSFSTASLEGYMGLMDGAALKLVSLLRGAARGREAVDMHRELGKMTLQVVGSSAYGVDFGTMNEGADDKQGSYQGHTLAKACQDFFTTASIMTGSWYTVASVFFPALNALISWVAAIFPDTLMKLQSKAREIIVNTSEELIRDWKAGAAAKSPRITTGSSDAPNSPTPKRLTSGVAPGSFLDLMLSARDKTTGQQLTDLQVLAQTQTFILAGYETTANALAFAVYCVANNPRVEEALLRELDTVDRSQPLTLEALDKLEYTDAIIQETLRLYPPAAATTRELKEAGNVGGYLLPAGTPLLIAIYTIQRSTDHWKQPDSFIPERFLPGHDELAAKQPHVHLPFGGGTRMCIGYKFALQEAKAALVRLYQHYTFKLVPGQVPLKLVNGITMGPANGIWVQVVPRE